MPKKSSLWIKKHPKSSQLSTFSFQKTFFFKASRWKLKKRVTEFGTVILISRTRFVWIQKRLESGFMVGFSIHSTPPPPKKKWLAWKKRGLAACGTPFQIDRTSWLIKWGLLAKPILQPLGWFWELRSTWPLEYLWTSGGGGVVSEMWFIQPGFAWYMINDMLWCCWWFRDPVNSPVEGTVVEITLFTEGLSTIQTVVVWDFWTTNSMMHEAHVFGLIVLYIPSYI